MVNWKKIKLYILFSFAISWTIALFMNLAHIETNSILWVILLITLYMPGPAWACFIIQRYIYKEGFKHYGLTFDKKALKWILATPLLFLGLTLLTFLIIAIFGNQYLIPQFGYLDFEQERINQRLVELAGSMFETDKSDLPNIPPYLLFIAMMLQGIIGGSTISLPFMFGEELGWRGLLLKETRDLGCLKSNLLIGFVWGIWHAPIILMGHNYPNHPYLGIIMMCLFTLSVSFLFAYVRIKTKSILGACMLHGMINATGAMYALFIAKGNELYSSIAGWAGILAGVLSTIIIVLLDKRFVSEYKTML